LRAIRVVEAEHGALRGDVGGAQAGGVSRIALDLGRAALVALDDDADAEAAERHRGGEEERLPEHDALRLLHVRDDALLGLPRAGAHAGERQRRAHELQEVAASGAGLADARGLARELVLEELDELVAFGELLEAAPQRLAMLPGEALADGRQVRRRRRRAGRG